MVALSRCAGFVSLLVAGAEGARVARNRASAPSTKFIAGVPVLNYDSATKPVLGELEGEEEQEWVMMMKPGATAAIKSMCQQNKNGCNFEGHASRGVPFVEMRATERELETILQSAKGAVRYVEPDMEISMIPEIASNVEAATWGLNRIGADSRSRTGSKATIFILDTGVRQTHNDFTGRASSAIDVSSNRLVECNGDIECAYDKQGHGTHCAGSAAGDRYGVAPQAKVRSAKVLSDQGSGSRAWSIAALDWIASSNVRPAVASMSLGGPGNSQGHKDAVDAAVAEGVTVVVAAGNDNSNACNYSPAFVPSAITVGSTDSRDSRSYFSNYGSCVDMWGPGSDVTSASHLSDSGTATFSGTSMACPHVAGGAALKLDESPSRKPSAVLSSLLDSAISGVITDLKSGDTNKLLYVGA